MKSELPVNTRVRHHIAFSEMLSLRMTGLQCLTTKRDGSKNYE